MMFCPTLGVPLFTPFVNCRSISGTGLMTASSSSSSYGKPFSFPGVESGSNTPAAFTCATFVIAPVVVAVAVICRFVLPPTASVPMVHRPLPDTYAPPLCDT